MQADEFAAFEGWKGTVGGMIDNIKGCTIFKGTEQTNMESWR